jgi:hypothetical protein
MDVSFKSSLRFEGEFAFTHIIATLKNDSHSKRQPSPKPMATTTKPVASIHIAPK